MDPSELPNIIRACQRQDQRAQAAFYSYYKGRLLGICYRYARTSCEAEDIFQEAFVKIFRQIDNLKSLESVHGWVKKIVIHTSIDHYRKETPLVSNAYQIELNIEPQYTLSNLFDDLERDQILSLINSLPDGYRIIVNLYLIDGYEHHEIAQFLGISIGTSKSQLSRAKALLRKKIITLGINKYENE